MIKIKNFINKLSKKQKIIFSTIIVGIVLFITIAIPTLAEFENEVPTVETEIWDGSIATSFKSGTGSEINPYVISNGAELAFLGSNLLNTNYENTYFILENDILLNEGILKYNSDDGITYLLNDETYYVEEFTNNYYDTKDMNTAPIGTINIFSKLPNFKGHISGNSHTIAGLYITENNTEELGLFTNLEGTISNVQIVNSLVYGGIVTGGVASTTSGATLNNILFDGYVIGTGKESNQTITLNPPDLVVNMVAANPPVVYIDILNTLPFFGGEIVSQTISGYFNPTNGPANQMNIAVNGVKISTGNKAAAFGPDNIGTNVQNLPVIGTIDNNNGSATLTNLVYTVTFNYAATGGLIGHSSNTNISNAINKAEVIGEVTSGGLVGTSKDTLDINASYNNGTIQGDFASGGLVGKLEKSTESNIEKSYNTGATSPVSIKSGGLIGMSFNNPGNINLNNVFNTTNNHTLGTIEHSSIFVTNGYYAYDEVIGAGVVNGDFTLQPNDVLQSENVLINMGFYEFISEEDLEEHPENCWVYEDNEYPLLYIDNKLKSSANLYVGANIYNSLNQNLNTFAFKSNITFLIEAASIFEPISEKYYYLAPIDSNLEKSDLDLITNWIAASDINQLTEEGSYVIYIKVVDSEGNVSYLNSDNLILDNTSPTGEISLEDDSISWNSLNENPDSIPLGKQISLNVSGNDTLSGINKIEYYISGEILNETLLNDLNESNWILYEDNLLTASGSNIYYLKITDNAGNITYFNTDYLVLNGYIFNNLNSGRIDNSYESTSISNNSVVTMNIGFNAEGTINIASYSHNLVSNILLPLNSKITLLDHKTNKIYSYKVETADDIYGFYNSCDGKSSDCINFATYNFNLFKEVGMSTDNYYVENSYSENGEIIEDFTIILDFSNSSIVNNYQDVKIYLELRDNNNESVRSTIADTISSFDIYGQNSSANVLLTTEDNINPLILNDNTYTEIDLNSKINYKYFDNKMIVDTTYESMNMSMSIKLVDSTGNIVDKQHLDNTVIKINDNICAIKENGTIIVPLNNNLSDSSKVLKIETYRHNSELDVGNYYFKIQTFTSYDGYYEGSIKSEELTIPVTVGTFTELDTHTFDILMDQSNHLISKINNEHEITFRVLYAGNYANPNIRVSLSKKDELTAYNQNYSIVDLNDFVTNNLTEIEPNYYNVPVNQTEFKLNLITSEFESNGYKFIFELYDGNTRMDSLPKYFIIK